MTHLLNVRELRTSFFTDKGEIPAVDNVSFQINEREIVGIVGESGCGKSVTSLSIMGLIPQPPGKIVGGEIIYNGKDLIHSSENEMQKIRGNEISMIFQEPMTSLNPLFTIGEQLIEAILIHQDISKKEAATKAINIMKEVGLPRAEQLMTEYPHQLSGGMRQRIVIAMALTCNPKLIIADEPTTALDVTIQAQILNLMKKINEERNTAIMLITHDLGVVAEVCDRVIVMYAGKVVEEGTVKEIFANPQHPYTKGLLHSIPQLDVKKEKLFSIKGQVPKPGSIKEGCAFYKRCEQAVSKCHILSPHLVSTSASHSVRCWLLDEEGSKACE
ncbi:peptide ABC transporter ATP-binding protein [Lottiidibacillus patelloidae]|uniref:Peptide ABC transporter ATP-binding protein n=1 Tax=Lottiidibacillus patelloidae TaxID=2670334 RepID=A0A263BUG0_9BACI|nr:ABC transporter ATP-binding protein [Lottiidibacillus patelloidae]OZM57208.1 peptide ABC transporter ATP-binding protein [Lottiidibacillus patelloidae]